MFRSLKVLENYEIGASDGAISHVNDFYFDDHSWFIRYFVVESSSWLSSRKGLSKPQSIDLADFGSSSRLGQKIAADINRQTAGERQPEDRYTKTSVATARNSTPPPLRLSVLLGWRWPLG